MLKGIKLFLLLILMSLSFLGGFSLFDSDNFNNNLVKYIFISVGCSIVIIYSPLEKALRKVISIFKKNN
jgi:hypothetical protein